MELRNRSVGLRQQVQHSHHAEIPIQNSQSHSTRYATNHTLHADSNIPYVMSSMKEAQQTGSPSQSTIRATTTTCKQQKTKTMLTLRLARHLR